MKNSLSAVFLSVGMYTHALGRFQIVDAVPADLERDESEHLHKSAAPVSENRLYGIALAHADVDSVAEQGDQGPGLFGIPCPEIAPGLFCPDGAQTDAGEDESRAKTGELVYMGHQLRVGGVPRAEKAVEGEQEGYRKQSVGEDVHDYMRDEPAALQDRHQRTGLEFRPEQIEQQEYR